jgi:hypothetical protein
MKSKQLANVLIKILGLSLCVQSGVHIVSEALGAFLNIRTLIKNNVSPGSILMSFFPSVLLVVIGAYLILRSRNVAGCLFRGEEE